MRRLLRFLVSVSFCFCHAALAAPLSTAFTYQGALKAGTTTAPDGNYDFQFSLYAVDTGGSPLAGPLVRAAEPVTNGTFTVALDFGAPFDGSARFLDIQVRKSGDPAFVTLLPRQAITPTPYALRAAAVTNDSIVAANIQAGAIAAGKIASNAVGSVEIADGSVGEAELADGSVTFSKLADNAVQGEKLAPGSVGLSKINPFEVQARVALLCPRGAPMIGVTQTGLPICDHPLRAIGNVSGDRVGVVIRADGRPLVALPGPRLYDCADANCTTATLTFQPGLMPGGNDVSLALRSDGLPVLSYAAQSGGPQYLVICGNTACSAGNTVRTPASDAFGAFSHVALRADNAPVAVYFDSAFNTKAIVCNDAACAAPTIVTLVAGSTSLSPAALRIRQNGTPVVALRSFGHPTHALYDCNDASCSSGTLRNLTQGIGSRFILGLAVRSDNRPLISNSDFSNGFLHDCVDAGCSANTPRTFAPGDTFSRSAIALRGDGRPLIAYVHSGSNTLKLFDCHSVDCSSGTARAVDQIDSFDSDDQIALTLRADGRPVLSYPATSTEYRLLMCATPACQ